MGQFGTEFCDQIAIVRYESEAWQQPASHFPNYVAGSWGPKEADDFIERDGRRWRRP